MSFILDALKKSENERQRQSGPALFEVKVAAPRSRLPLWGTLIAVLLAVNLLVVSWVLLHGSRASSPAAQPIVPAMRAPEAAAAATPAPLKAAALPSAASAPAAAPPAPSTASSEQDSDASGDPDDDAPAVDAPRAAPAAAAGVQRATDSGLPTYQDAAAAPGAGIPELKLDVHAFDDNPGNRFVFLNGRSLREGELSPEGVRVETITRDGVILSYHGSRFVLLSP